jgi:hypothetical protein
MSKRPELTAGLIAVKGHAVPAMDMPTRSAPVSPQSISLPREDKPGKGPLQPLNFRISPDFRRSFKTYAARHDLKLNELLVRSFDAYRARQGD